MREGHGPTNVRHPRVDEQAHTAGTQFFIDAPGRFGPADGVEVGHVQFWQAEVVE